LPENLPEWKSENINRMQEKKGKQNVKANLVNIMV
jgi:hypothetical protein